MNQDQDMNLRQYMTVTERMAFNVAVTAGSREVVYARVACRLAEANKQQQAILDDIDALWQVSHRSIAYFVALLCNDPGSKPHARIEVYAKWLEEPTVFEGKDLAEALRNAVLAKQAAEQAEEGNNDG